MTRPSRQIELSQNPLRTSQGASSATTKKNLGLSKAI